MVKSALENSNVPYGWPDLIVIDLVDSVGFYNDTLVSEQRRFPLKTGELIEKLYTSGDLPVIS